MRLLASGIAHDDVEPAEAVDRALDQVLAKRLLTQIAGDAQSHSAFRLDQRDDLLGVRFLGREIVDGDIGAFARKCDGGGSAHA
jgi:hypothetical protein